MTLIEQEEIEASEVFEPSLDSRSLHVPISGPARPAQSEKLSGNTNINWINDVVDIPKMGGGKLLPPTLDEESYVVTFEGDNDPSHPYNWLLGKKIVITSIVSLYSLCNSIGTSIYSQSSEDLMKVFDFGREVSTIATSLYVFGFDFGREVSTIATSLYVFGFAFGPAVWAPFSEIYGRKLVYLPSCFCFTCLSFAIATAKDLQTIMICRFLSGFCGGSAMVLSSSTIGDMFPPRYRGRAMAPFGLTVCIGPLIGPIIGGFTAKSDSLGWRWNAYWIGIFGSILLILIIFVLSESYHPAVLTKKAIRIRRKTKNWAIHSPQETLDLSFGKLCAKYLIKPIYMLFTETILLSIAVYGGFVYGLIFVLLDVIPSVFSGYYKFSQGVSELPYIGAIFGAFIASNLQLLFDIRYRGLMAKSGGIHRNQKNDF